MNHINIPYVSSIGSNPDMEEVSTKLDHLNKMTIAESPWANYFHKPKVSFTIAHAGHAVLLKYQVSENSILAVHRITNQPVYKDSCVEFFISFNNENEYYNFEFNCIGTCLAGFGSGKNERELLQADLIKEIKVNSMIKSASPDGLINWELSLLIPVTVFSKHQIISMDGQYCRMNFYKCGDNLPEPHYLTWSTIISEAPDFHLPKFFGSGLFAGNPEPILT